jgi:hypothetical protein
MNNINIRTKLYTHFFGEKLFLKKVILSIVGTFR